MNYPAGIYDDTAPTEPLRTTQLEAYDFPTIMATVVLVGIGLISIYSATYQTPMASYFSKQLIFALVGAGVFVVALFAPVHLVRASIPLLYGVALVLLLAVLVPGIGVKIHGQRCWIAIGGFQFQPSEFAKLATLLMAGFQVASWPSRSPSGRELLQLLGIVLVPMVLVLLEKDAGTASVFAAMLLGILLLVGVPMVVLLSLVVVPVSAITAIHGAMYHTVVGMLVVAVIASTVGYVLDRRWWAPVVILAVVGLVSYGSTIAFGHLPEYQRGRIRTFFEPEKYPKEEGYHVLQSLIAIGSGGVTGKGYLHGTQTQLRYIPEQWTDFIFCVPAEEFGFIGAAIVLVLYGIVLLRLERIWRYSSDPVASVLTFGFATVVLYHVLVNVGMTIGLMPVMGIPLPLMSAGGTALLVNMATIGLILNFHRRARLVERLQ
ncbi:MAG: rod shape-determining protein RodA [Candidatus Kapaibacterium sp.]|nr:MAG: rod shape-determining protein RodA [Candidatus Kapabacteria bacterium]